MSIRRTDVAIIGGGASGLAAAIEIGLRRPDLKVLIIEKNSEAGRKIRATGSGRCNISNSEAPGYERIMKFFSEIGLMTRSYDNGLVYPHSESAADVSDLLIGRATSLGIDLACSEEVLSVKKISDDESEKGCPRFEIESVTKDAKGERRLTTQASYVVLATGGKAGPSYGTTGDGYRIAKELGHSIVSPVPILTGIECEEWDESADVDAHVLAGTRTAGVVSLYKESSDDPVFSEAGEIQFTKYGLSGICVFNMTRYMRLDKAAGESLGDFKVAADLLPNAKIADYINERKQGAFSECSIEALLQSVLKGAISQYIMGLADASGINVSGPVSSLTDQDVSTISALVHKLSFHPKGLRGWKDAQATSGGVAEAETDSSTSESKLQPGLYITGELLDRDFPCGGFNLSNAWLTGLAAADDIAERSTT